MNCYRTVIPTMTLRFPWSNWGGTGSMLVERSICLCSGRIRRFLETNGGLCSSLFCLCLHSSVGLGSPRTSRITRRCSLCKVKPVEITIDTHVPVLAARSLICLLFNRLSFTTWGVEHHRTWLTAHRGGWAWGKRIKTFNARKAHWL